MTAPLRRAVAVCAPPPHFNPGMHCVDLALDAVLRRHALDVSLERRVLYQPADYGLPFPYRTFRGSPRPFADARFLLFWGDFLHSRHYGAAVARRLVKSGQVPDAAAARRYVDRCLFLKGLLPEAGQRTIVFGECLLTDDPDGRPEDDYETLLADLMRSARRVWMRDVLSAERVSDLRREPGVSHLGVDCALLLRPDDVEAVAGARRPAVDKRGRPRLGVFFARTLEDPALLLRLAALICERLEAEASWLAWFPSRPEMEAARAAAGLEAQPTGAGADRLPAVLRALLGCDAVVTDVYHLSVVAWNCGIPALCVGRGASVSRTSLSDKKKELFYGMYGAERLYLFAEHLAALVGAETSADRGLAEDARPPSLQLLVEALTDRDRIASVQQRIARRREAAESALVQELERLP